MFTAAMLTHVMPHVLPSFIPLTDVLAARPSRVVLLTKCHRSHIVSLFSPHSDVLAARTSRVALLTNAMPLMCSQTPCVSCSSFFHPTYRCACCTPLACGAAHGSSLGLSLCEAPRIGEFKCMQPVRKAAPSLVDVSSATHGACNCLCSW